MYILNLTDLDQIALQNGCSSLRAQHQCVKVLYLCYTPVNTQHCSISNYCQFNRYKMIICMSFITNVCVSLHMLVTLSVPKHTILFNSVIYLFLCHYHIFFPMALFFLPIMLVFLLFSSFIRLNSLVKNTSIRFSL